MLDEALNNYTSVDNGYDSVFKYYAESVKGLIPLQIETFMAKGAPGNQYFDCVVRVGEGKNGTPQACPFIDGGVESWDVYVRKFHLTRFIYDSRAHGPVFFLLFFLS